MAACPIAAPVVDADTRLFHGFDQAPRLPGPPRLRTERRSVRHETPAMPALMDHLDLRTQRDYGGGLVTGPQPRRTRSSWSAMVHSALAPSTRSQVARKKMSPMASTHSDQPNAKANMRTTKEAPAALPPARARTPRQVRAPVLNG